MRRVLSAHGCRMVLNINDTDILTQKARGCYRIAGKTLDVKGVPEMRAPRDPTKTVIFTCPALKSIVVLRLKGVISFMWYWIVMFVLAAGSIAMLSVSFISIKKRNDRAVYAGGGGRRGYGPDDDEEIPDAPRRRRRREEDDLRGQDERPRRKKKRQWKIILEDIDSWDKYTFTFYDTVGIGRGKDGSMYEKYLPVAGDGRVSKIHCVIIRRGDKLYLKDEGSRNGTYLNGERLDGPAVIQRDDIIGVGETRFEVQRILRESE